ncbi:MAG: zinc ribbon domain-containing protein [Gemmatimonas sp.]
MNVPAEALPLAIGTALAIGALSVVLAPLLSDKASVDDKPTTPKAKKTNAEGTAVAALREIEFDKATGKLSDKDYDALRAMYTRAALAELRAADNLATVAAHAGGPVTDDMVEAAIRRAKNARHDCTVCGPRPEPDAVFCSSCGRYLAGNCASCGTPVELVGARFCVGCGEGLAAA